MKKFTYLFVLLFLPFMADAQVFFEDFNGGFPLGWKTIDNDGLTPAGAVSYVSNAWVVIEDTDTTGVGDSMAVSTSWYTPAGISDDYMITPILTLNASAVLTFDVRAPDAAFLDGYEVMVSTTTPDVAGFTANPPLKSVAAAPNAWAQDTVDLAAAGYMNQDVYLAIRNNSNDKFLLFVDNIKVDGATATIVLPAFDARIIGVTRPSNYTILPEGEFASASFDFGGVLENLGTDPVTNAQLNVEVYEDGTSVYSASSAGVSIAGGATSAATIPAYTPSGGPGTIYTFEYFVSIAETDDDTSNDTIIPSAVAVTDTLFARDDGVSDGGLGFTGGTGVFGNMFELTTEDTLTSATVLLGNPPVGDPTRFLLYGFGNQVAGAPDTTAMDSTDFFVLTATSNVLTLPFPCARVLAPGQYFLAIEQIATNNLSCGYDLSNYIPGTTFFGDGSSAWTEIGAVPSLASALIVRMNLGTVVDRIAASVSASSETVCAGETISLLANSASTATYAWTGAGLIDTVGATVSAMPTVTTDYTVVASDAFGCSSSATISVNVNEAPTVASSATIAWSGLTNGTATATVTGGLAPYTYLWDDPSAQTTETAIGLGPGSYMVTVTDANGCSSTSTVTVDEATTGLDPLSENLIQLYPNPSNGKFTLQGLEELGLDSEITVRVMDTKGSEVHIERVEGQDKIEIDLSYAGLPVGLYMIEVRNEESRWTKQMMIK